MSNRWKFDEQFLINTIKDTNRLLKDKNISLERKQDMQESISHFSLFLDIIQNNYRIKKNEDFSELTFVDASKKFIIKAEKDFYEIGEEIINSIIYIANEHQFKNFDYEDYYNKTTPDEIVNESLKVYKEFLPNYYWTANSIIEYPIKLINFSDNETIGSMCFYDKIFRLPFIHVERQNESPSAFIHELQHGVEMLNNYSNNYYGELGSILLETIYVDNLVKKRYLNASSLYFERICESEQLLDYIASYFRVLKYLRKNNFLVGNGQLIKVLHKNELVYEDRMEIADLLDENFNELLVYLISFFKSLEIRKWMYQDKIWAAKLIKKEIARDQKLNINADTMISNYEDFLKEVLNKAKKYPHSKKYSKKL